jgi:hypothetical protein
LVTFRKSIDNQGKREDVRANAILPVAPNACFMIAKIEQEIKEYRQKVIKGQVRCSVKICPRCEQKPDLFKRHDVRQRQFLVIVERLIVKVMSFLVRMKCSLCGKTFTQYPSFALPYKRYVSRQIIERTLSYLQDDTMTYERATLEQNAIATKGRSPPGQPMPVFYQDPGKASGLAASTVHRWVTTLGGLQKTLRAATNLLLEKDTDIHRLCFDVPARKYRSRQRRSLLQDCLRLFHVEARCRVLFKRSIFPELGIRYCWQ